MRNKSSITLFCAQYKIPY